MPRAKLTTFALQPMSLSRDLYTRVRMVNILDVNLETIDKVVKNAREAVLLYMLVVRMTISLIIGIWDCLVSMGWDQVG